jgi:hypothetical protein
LAVDRFNTEAQALGDHVLAPEEPKRTGRAELGAASSKQRVEAPPASIVGVLLTARVVELRAHTRGPRHVERISERRVHELRKDLQVRIDGVWIEISPLKHHLDVEVQVSLLGRAQKADPRGVNAARAAAVLALIGILPEHEEIHFAGRVERQISPLIVGTPEAIIDQRLVEFDPVIDQPLAGGVGWKNADGQDEEHEKLRLVSALPVRGETGTVLNRIAKPVSGDEASPSQIHGLPAEPKIERGALGNGVVEMDCPRGSRTRAFERIVLDEDLGRNAVFLVNLSDHRQCHPALSAKDFARARSTPEGSR